MSRVLEDYSAFDPPAWMRRTVERLLASLSPGHLNGLGAIVLTDAMRSERRTASRRPRNDRRGVAIARYHPGWAGERPWIEIMVDRVLADLPHQLRGVQWARDIVVSRALYHQIGHHLHRTVGSAARGGAPSAAAWRIRLTELHFKRRYWYLRPFLSPLRAFVKMVVRRERARSARAA